MAFNHQGTHHETRLRTGACGVRAHRACLHYARRMAVKDGGATTYTALAASATATFALVLDPPAHEHEVRYETAVLRVKVRNPNADPGVVLHRPSGSPVWLFPVRVQFAAD